MSDQTPTGTGSPPTGLTVDQAASAFGAMLAPPPADKPEGDEEQPGVEATAKAEGEQPSGEQEAEATVAEGEESAEEGAEPEAKDAQDEEDDSEAPAEQKFTLHIEGKDEEVPLGELKNGYLRQRDYTRKTQSLSNERKQFVQEQETVRAERTEYQNLLPKLRAALEQAGAKAPDPALRETDPQKYLLERAAYEEQRDALAKIEQQERLAQQRAQRDREAQIEQIANEQHNLLMKALPSWADQKVADAEGKQIVDALKSVGFSGKELEIFDHRAILIARMAALYLQGQSKAAAVAPKLKAAPVVKPGAPQRKSTESDRAKAERARLAKTGRPEDAAAIFNRMFK